MITKIIEHNISINEINTLTSIKAITSIRQFIFVYLKTTANSSKKELAHHLCSPHIYMACKMENDFKILLIFINNLYLHIYIIIVKYWRGLPSGMPIL